MAQSKINFAWTHFPHVFWYWLLQCLSFNTISHNNVLPPLASTKKFTKHIRVHCTWEHFNDSDEWYFIFQINYLQFCITRIENMDNWRLEMTKNIYLIFSIKIYFCTCYKNKNKTITFLKIKPIRNNARFEYFIFFLIKI